MMLAINARAQIVTGMTGLESLTGLLAQASYT